MYSYKTEPDNGNLSCYQKKTEITEEYQDEIFKGDSFNNFISNQNNFHIKKFDLNNTNNYSVEDCQKEAEKHYANFFLVNDLKYSRSNDNFNYTCTIPKNDLIYRPTQKETTDKSDIFTYLIAPVNDFIDNIFSNNSLNSPQNIDNSNDLKTHLNNNSNDCVIYNEKDSDGNTIQNNNLNAFGGKDKYVIYKSNFINDERNNILNVERKLDDYNNFYEDINNSDGSLNTSFWNSLIIINNIVKNINIYQRDNDSQVPGYETTIMNYITQIQNEVLNFWKNIFDTNTPHSLGGYFKSIYNDTDLINNANRNYLNFIGALEDEIKKEKIKFNKLKSTKNGNNAKLHDINFLKQIKIIEIIFFFNLPLIVLFLIVYKN